MKKTENILASSVDTEALMSLDTASDAKSGSLVDLKSPEPIRSFKIKFDDAELNDLRQRIMATRWPKRETVNDATQGVQLNTIQKLAKYWANDYDWRKVEAKLNSYPNFVTKIDGLDIHFIHVRSKHVMLQAMLWNHPIMLSVV